MSQAKLVTSVKKGKSVHHSVHQIFPKICIFADERFSSCYKWLTNDINNDNVNGALCIRETESWSYLNALFYLNYNFSRITRPIFTILIYL